MKVKERSLEKLLCNKMRRCRRNVLAISHKNVLDGPGWWEGPDARGGSWLAAAVYWRRRGLSRCYYY